MANFYDSASPTISFYGSITSGEPNMRQELINFFDGNFPEIAKAQNGLLRRMNRDSNGNLIPCNCVDIVTKEPDKDRFCPVCFSEGYVWSEENLQIYRKLESTSTGNALKDSLREPGLINIPLIVFYIRYDADITRDDKIVRLILSEAGSPVEPYQRQGIYRINSAWDFRSDNGKLEYWKLYTHLEDVKYLNTPDYGDA